VKNRRLPGTTHHRLRLSLVRSDCRGLIITAKGNQDYDFVSRFFAPRVGVLEDPVTGSAHCKLADYWQKKLNKTQFLAYQASKRGGEIQLSIHNERVLLTGYAVTIIQADLQI
jgi:PhzF family phenazine biosynthesis protein